ncbi:glyoxylase-like metal-dependent hydrolase (beta-lactamase superfamily II) [Peribacillus deserti]|uniref:Glyoxylase-like metal-dependent hydrolase (Beta-lactamase superfamily II) n=1 Tax=Peribacillus deserti TaxID=673318 RepID=A0ABS2QHD1_9BACI|nr:MBL fold metallo-hydrolase [Peribacillus deserti]MBM7692571.1 glyoxylase-like metal-dependent hydrolase (beta-lactamase superfamily II) [Peribacillus deserti]
MTDEPLKRFIPVTSISSGTIESVVPDVFSYTNQVVNLFFVKVNPSSSEWVLVDAGMPRSGDEIMKAARDLFGENTCPKAIVLTHGHFDHVGGLGDLLSEWDVPVYAHALELPFLTGVQNYPEPDPTVEGGMVAKMSKMFPNQAIDLSGKVQMVPENGHVPELPDWKWIHTPGHSPGHISLFRVADRTLIAGDAFVTVRQDELYKVLTQKKEITGPPRYLTTDWKAAKQSVKTLAELEPETAVTGHGMPVFGEELKAGLKDLAAQFDQIAVPSHGKYVDGDKH